MHVTHVMHMIQHTIQSTTHPVSHLALENQNVERGCVCDLPFAVRLGGWAQVSW